MQGVNDNSESRAGRRFAASGPALLLPAFVVSVGYALILAGLVTAGRGDGALARLCMVVLGVGGPFLFAHAVLVRYTLRVDLLSHSAFLHPGFPAQDPVEVPYARILSVTLRRGLAGRLTGSGTLVVVLDDGRRVAIAGLDRPERAAEAINAEVERGRRNGNGAPRAATASAVSAAEGLVAHF